MHWRWHEAEFPGTPWDNMATDLALFEAMQSDQSPPIVRVYRWDRPSVSFGRLQDQREVERAFGGLPAVRRPTGGRAVQHGADLTFTVVARQSDLPPTVCDHSVLASYRLIVSGLIAAFQHLGVPARLGKAGRRVDGPLPVDCFSVAASCDVVAETDGRKLMGCAQRRQGGVILQQMSIPLTGVSDAAAFVRAAQHEMGQTLGVGEWIPVDTPLPV